MEGVPKIYSTYVKNACLLFKGSTLSQVLCFMDSRRLLHYRDGMQFAHVKLVL